MSGLEVVGVVLGVLPLAVKALQGYMSVLSSMKHSQRNLNALIRDLETEHIRLQTTCELLLEGIAPPSVIDRLIQTPFGPDWRPYNDPLRLRLWTTAAKFEEQVAELQAAVSELRAKLCLEADGTTKLTDRRSISQQLKRSTSFTLKKKDYDEVLTRIKTANSVLHELAGQNCGLEPARRHRSRIRLIRLVRSLAGSIFTALLCSSSPCSCPEAHDVCLELEPREAILIPADSEDEVAKTFDFHAAMSSGRGSALGRPGASPEWKDLYLKLAAPTEAETQGADLNLLPSIPLTPASPRKSQRSLTWAKSLGSMLTRTPSSQSTLSLQSASSSQTYTSVSTGLSSIQTSASGSTTCTSVSSTQTLVEPAKTFTLSPSPPEHPTEETVSNLCQTIFTNGKGLAADRYGYVADAERRFELRPPPQSPSDSRHVVTLRTLLNEKNGTLPPFDYPQKLKVAIALSVNILHLFSTPWFSNVVTLDDILFFHEGFPQPPSPDHESTYQPFVIQKLHAEATKRHRRLNRNIPRPVNLPVLSLGALLVQVITGRVIDALDMSDCMDMSSILSKYDVGAQLSSEVLEKGGIQYDSVVKWCLRSVLEVGGFESDKFCQDFYGAVVAKLKEDAKLIDGLDNE
ncbi:hypothetical protein QBC34DRAFT_489656 [Podospora aff. communis PSN243]|uniref:DUF7580 domain-containing protein n=1 Tax=Podospora aff. communis PSN243 TaxID=3040156 RepID=A0AAV9H4J7_9PEZI|nr:hypothetical protein QBC34DRAFT_489656 [Podospora aff. communis PSN243]